MTYPEFLDNLSELRGQFHLDERRQIRAQIGPRCLCPIEALEHRLMGHVGSPVGKAIGIDSDWMRTQIIYAADNHRPSPTIIRADLLRVLGLSENA